jgi:hypothetical protein
MTSPRKTTWRWESYQSRSGARLDGIAGSFSTAKEEAEKAHADLGFKGVVTKLVSPHGIEWQYTTREDNRSGMIWRRYL